MEPQQVVQLANGEKILAKNVISGADLRTIFLKLVDPYYLEPKFVRNVKNMKYHSTMARAHFVLGRLPIFSGLNGGSERPINGHIQIAHTVTYIQQEYDPVKYGSYSRQPYLDVQIPTLTDSSIAPEGKHIMSVTVEYLPYKLSQGNWDDLRETIAALVINILSDYAPDFGQCVQNYHVITPLDIEKVYNLPKGNPVHGEMTLNQFMLMLPIPGYDLYRAPIDGL